MAEPQGISKWWQDVNKAADQASYAARKPGTIVPGLINLGQSVGRFVSSQPQAPTGAGAGDIYAKDYLKQLAARYPSVSQTAAKASGSGVRTPTPAQGTRGYVPPTATPASIAAMIQKPSLTGGAGGGMGAPTQPQAFGAMDLYSDPAAIYDPAMQQLEQQKTAANERYAKNQASIKNIFGSLSDLSAKDALRIQDQFKATIASQQANLAARTAAAQGASAAGAAQAVETGAERGQGPAMVESPAEQATAEGIGRSNEYQTTWEALQNANASQAVIDATSRQTGYGQQQVGALQQLQQNLEDKLMQIGGNETAVQQDIAKARYAAQQQVRDTLYNEAQQQAAAAASGGSGGGASTSTKSTSYPKTIYGLEQRVVDSLRDANAFSNLQSSVTQAYDLAARRLAADPKNVNKNVAPSKVAVQKAWNSLGGGGKYSTFAKDYINNYLGLK